MSDEKEQDFCDRLGFCGCGMPDELLPYVADALRHVADLSNNSPDAWDERRAELYPVPGSDWFMWEVLNEKGLTEHGGSVPGWLTDKGKALLAELENAITK